MRCQRSGFGRLGLDPEYPDGHPSLRAIPLRQQINGSIPGRRHADLPFPGGPESGGRPGRRALLRASAEETDRESLCVQSRLVVAHDFEDRAICGTFIPDRGELSGHVDLPRLGRVLLASLQRFGRQFQFFVGFRFVEGDDRSLVTPDQDMVGRTGQIGFLRLRCPRKKGSGRQKQKVNPQWHSHQFTSSFLVVRVFRTREAGSYMAGTALGPAEAIVH